MHEAQGNFMLPMPTASGQVGTMDRIAVHLMNAAIASAVQARKIEQDHDGEDLGNFFSDLIGAVSISVILAVNAMEANLNESLRLYEDGNWVHQDAGTLSSCMQRELARILKMQSILDKHKDAVTCLADPQRLDKGKEPWATLKIVVDTRNSLTHFKPEWASKHDQHLEMSKALSGKFTPSQFAKGSSLFLKGMMTYDCCRWAITTCLDCASELQDSYKIRNALAENRAKFILP